MQRTNATTTLEMSVLKAHQLKEIKFLLIPYFTFRAYINFGGRDKKKGHFYGNEHRCTYNQCLFRKIPHIILNKAHGFYGLVKMIEGLKGKYTSAHIYMRSEGSSQFDTLCYEWYKGGLTKHFQPDLNEEEVRVLYYDVLHGQVHISEHPTEDPATIDFEKEVAAALKPAP